jgi:hypothetical protein
MMRRKMRMLMKGNFLSVSLSLSLSLSLFSLFEQWYDVLSTDWWNTRAF